MTCTTEAAPITQAKMAELVGIGRFGSVTASATARQAETEGALKGHVSKSSGLIRQGYAAMKTIKMPGARNTAMRVPTAWA